MELRFKDEMMLLRFGVSNFRSINERQELSMIADKSIKDNNEGIIEVDSPSLKERVLPAALIYGANASGKTSIVEAFKAMCNFAISSTTVKYSEKIYTPFRLDDNTQQQPCSFDMDFLFDNVRYHYGFSLIKTEVIEEYLYSFPEGKKRLLFERSNELEKVKFGASFRGKLKEIETLTRPDALLMSTAYQFNHPALTKIFLWFLFSQNMGASEIFHPGFCKDFPSEIIPFLTGIGTGIIDYRFIGASNEIKKSTGGLGDIFAGSSFGLGAAAQLLNIDNEKIQFGHRAKNGEIVFFDAEMESLGTKRIVGILMSSLEALKNGNVFIIDELDASLHTKLAEKLIQLFQNKATNPKGAQLIATTHDTNLMSSAHLRRDQIWFTEKNPEQATQLYPLTDFNTRKEGNVEKGYLDGRYGAIPYGGSIAALFSK
jgi:AAA15 family ATPase/GTPase